MLVFSNEDKKIPELRSLSLTLGIYDGVHLGHRKILRRVMERADRMGGTSCVVTFDPHPRQILNPDTAPDLLTSTTKKIELIEAIGIDAVCLIRFTPEFARIEARAFVRDFLIDTLHAKVIVEGYDWRFGRNRKGDVKLLREMGKENGYEVEQIDGLVVDGQVISSTFIRELVLRGNLEETAKYLGRRYSVTGDVVEGTHLGRKIGFPTANIKPHHEAIPPNGIYAVWVDVAGGRKPGTLNIGYRPTVTEQRNRTVEVHIMDFYEDIYGEDIEITFVENLRDEEKFPSLEALTDQIKKDVENARRILVEQSDAV